MRIHTHFGSIAFFGKPKRYYRNAFLLPLVGLNPSPLTPSNGEGFKRKWYQWPGKAPEPYRPMLLECWDLCRWELRQAREHCCPATPQIYPDTAQYPNKSPRCFIQGRGFEGLEQP